MAALGGNYDNSAASSSGEITVLLAAGVTLYPGAGICVESGYAVPARLSTGLTTAGALKSVRVVVGGSADGDVPAVVEISNGPNGLRTYAYDNDPGAGAFAQSDIPGVAYWLDDHTVTSDSSGASRAGTAWSLDSDGRVRIAFDQ